MTAWWQRPKLENPRGELAGGTTIGSAIPSSSTPWGRGAGLKSISHSYRIHSNLTNFIPRIGKFCWINSLPQHEMAKVELSKNSDDYCVIDRLNFLRALLDM